MTLIAFAVSSEELLETANALDHAMADTNKSEQPEMPLSVKAQTAVYVRALFDAGMDADTIARTFDLSAEEVNEMIRQTNAGAS